MLLILHADASRAWTVAELSSELRSSPYAIESRMPGLLNAKLAEKNGDSYRYAATGRSHAFVEELQAEYVGRRFSVIDLVFARPSAIQFFADAFKIKDDRDDVDR